VINFTLAFDSAWERMMIILFRPFDLGKWFVIGFSAFLAGLVSGGNGFNNASLNKQGHFSLPNQETLSHSMNRAASAFSAFQAGFVALLVIGVVGLGLALAVLIYWLGARGQFLLLDNIVRNRGAIAEPWLRYARQANRVFFFYLICLAVSITVMLILGVPALLIGLPALTHHVWLKGASLLALVALGLVYFVFGLLVSCFVFIFREWGVPLVFRHDLTLGAAVSETWSIIRHWPGSTFLFLVLRFALALGLIVMSVLVCCATCCVAAFPYLGTVVLLPALLYIKCFSLDCLAQLGPAYNVWTVDVPPGAAPEIPR
jgi:hypothetical protein